MTKVEWNSSLTRLERERESKKKHLIFQEITIMVARFTAALVGFNPKNVMQKYIVQDFVNERII